MTSKLIYTAIPKYLHFAHDYILRYVLQCGHAPLTPYTTTFWLLDTVERDAIRNANKQYIDAADEIWVFGVDTNTGFEGWMINDLHVTDGVIEEIQIAKENDVPVKLHQIDVDSQTIISRGELDLSDELSITNPSETPDLF